MNYLTPEGLSLYYQLIMVSGLFGFGVMVIELGKRIIKGQIE